MKLLILSASTGGGHDMRAFALQSWWKKGEGREAVVTHPLESGSIFYRFGTELYNVIQKKAPWLHTFYFSFLEHAKLHRSTRMLLGKKKFLQSIRDHKPDIILSVHAHLNHAYFKLAKTWNPAVRFVVYCGEFADGHGFSKHWVNPHTDLFTGPFSSTCEAAIKYGMPQNKVKEAGFILREPFYREKDIHRTTKYLKSLGINPEEKFILLGTGANGTNNHPQVYRELTRSINLHKYRQVVALCGKNETTLKNLISQARKSKVKLIALSKVDAEGMVALLSHAACLLARPGAGLSAEAVAMNTPMIFNLWGGVMPQETNNLNYWELKTGRYVSIRTPQELPALLSTDIPSLGVTLPKYPPIIDILLELTKDE